MNLRASYTALAPIYDLTIRALTRSARARSCAWLSPMRPMRVLVAGIGTGLDLPYLPPQHEYTGLDLTWAMLARSRPRGASRRYHAVQGDVMALPFAAHSFDAAVLHLILAVVPDPARCLAECLRVLRPGGTVLIFDKFLRPGQRARLRRFANPLSRRVATRLDVVFEEVTAGLADAEVIHDEPALAGGWFRLIRVRRGTTPAGAGALRAGGGQASTWSRPS
jgi:ubiquinone/menaquinone biosynthesis C-methylase UbiE